jgi:O-antigen/teichoic acid export membrane protein
MGGLALNQAINQMGGALLARWLTDVRVYGELSFVLQFLNLAALGLGLGLNSALVYDVATHRPETGRSFAAAWVGALAGAAALVGVCDLVAPLVGRLYGVPGFGLATALGSLALFAQALLNLTTSLQGGLRRFGSQMALMVAGTALAVVGRLLAAPALAHGASPGWVALSGGLGTAVAAAAGLWLAARMGLPGRLRGVAAYWQEVRRMLRYGSPLWASNLLKSFQQPYLVLIAGGAGMATAGFVASDVGLLGWPFLVTWAFRIVAVPLIASAHAPEERRRRTTVCFRLNNLALFPVVALCCLWPHLLVTAVYGARFAPAARLLPLLAVGVFGSSVGRLATDALAAVGDSRASVPIMLISSVPLLLGGPFALRLGAGWLAALYCAGWLLSAAYAYQLLRRVGLAVDGRVGFLEPLLPTAAAAAVAAVGAALPAPAQPFAPPLAAALLLALSLGVFQMGGHPGRGAGPAATAEASAREARPRPPGAPRPLTGAAAPD